MTAENNKMRLAIVASAAGTLLEWYDLFLAIIMAKTLSSQLFPSGQDTYFLETLAIVGSSFFIRPLGALFFGNLGDRQGRKKSFLLSLLLMGGATFLIGLLPGYAQIGWFAPILLLVLRMVQGFALSGEYAGAIIYVSENAPPHRRGYYTGFIQATVPLGLVICLLVVVGVQRSMSTADFSAWGWRIPFLSSAVLVVFSYLVRRKMHETPFFEELKANGDLPKSPVREALSNGANRRKMGLLIFGCNTAQSSIMQTAQFVTLYFLQRAMKIEDATAYLILALALLVGTPFHQLAGHWSDTYGRKKVILTGIWLALFSIPLSFWAFYTFGNPTHSTVPHGIPPATLALFVFLTFVNTLASALVYGPMGVYISEMFEGRTRYTSMGFTHNISNGLLGGSTPLITEFLKANLVVGAAFAPYVGLLYPMTIIIIALVVSRWLIETRPQPTVMASPKPHPK